MADRQSVRTGAFGGLGGGQGDSAQTEQFEEGGGLLVELTQLSLCPRQVHTAEKQEQQTSHRSLVGSERVFRRYSPHHPEAAFQHRLRHNDVPFQLQPKWPPNP